MSLSPEETKRINHQLDQDHLRYRFESGDGDPAYNQFHRWDTPKVDLATNRIQIGHNGVDYDEENDTYAQRIISMPLAEHVMCRELRVLRSQTSGTCYFHAAMNTILNKCAFRKELELHLKRRLARNPFTISDHEDNHSPTGTGLDRPPIDRTELVQSCLLSNNDPEACRNRYEWIHATVLLHTLRSAQSIPREDIKNGEMPYFNIEKGVFDNEDLYTCLLRSQNSIKKIVQSMNVDLGVGSNNLEFAPGDLSKRAIGGGGRVVEALEKIFKHAGLDVESDSSQGRWMMTRVSAFIPNDDDDPADPLAVFSAVTSRESTRFAEDDLPGTDKASIGTPSVSVSDKAGGPSLVHPPEHLVEVLGDSCAKGSHSGVMTVRRAGGSGHAISWAYDPKSWFVFVDSNGSVQNTAAWMALGPKGAQMMLKELVLDYGTSTQIVDTYTGVRSLPQRTNRARKDANVTPGTGTSESESDTRNVRNTHPRASPVQPVVGGGEGHGGQTGQNAPARAVTKMAKPSPQELEYLTEIVALADILSPDDSLDANTRAALFEMARELDIGTSLEQGLAQGGHFL